MEDMYSTRPERRGAQNLILSNGQPMDLTGFRQKVSQQDMQKSSYVIPLGAGTTSFDFQIGAEQAYLNDAQVWAYIYKATNANGTPLAAAANETATISELSHLIHSIEIQADGQVVCSISDARFILSIIQQRKQYGSEEQWHFKKDDCERVIDGVNPPVLYNEFLAAFDPTVQCESSLKKARKKMAIYAQETGR